MGLAVTEMGGILLPVEVATMVGKGEVLITGQLGDVMRESAFAALSYIRSRAEELQIDPNFQDSTDLHIHMPENALPKDGPSAGITIATALISALTGRPIRPGIAMTGEITLRGRVLGIGGLKEKVLAAHHANIYNLLIPLENKKDLADVPAKIRQSINFTIVDSMDQVIRASLLEAPDTESREQESPQILPLHLDEHISASRYSNDHNTHRSITADEHREDEESGSGHSTVIIPPTERLSDDSYPHAKVQEP
jgi:ATP-dependent Lon protease